MYYKIIGPYFRDDDELLSRSSYLMIIDLFNIHITAIELYE